MDEQEYFQALLNEFGTRLSLDPQLRQIMKKIGKGKADFSDTAQLSERASNLLGEVFGANIPDIPAEAREAICTALLKDRYDSMNETLAAVQETLDEPLGLHLTPQKAPFPSERVEQLAHSLIDPTVKPETIRRRANQPVATVAKSFHDDYIKTNARFRNRLGLKPVIKRFGVGCCQWCAEVAGTYRFGEQPEDVFRRHDNCGCVIIYDTQVLRGARTADGGSSRAWTEVDPSDLQQNPPASLSQEEAQELERFARQRLTLAGERDIIEVASNAHPRNPELEAIIKRCIQQDKPFFDDGRLGKYSERIPPEENRYITSMHGTNKSVMLYDQAADAKILANIIRKRSDYNGEEIVLISCNTGNTDAGENCFAQQLANELGVRVHAPTRYGAVNSKGEYYSSDKSGLKRDGEFKPFEPRRE